MKRIVASVGLLALGASVLEAQDVTAPEAVKPYSLSLTLRGFYDDNPDTTPKKDGTFGFEVSPAVGLGWKEELTTFTLAYVYSLKYYGRQLGTFEGVSSSHYDSTHIFNLGFTHTFTERYKMSITDSFVVGQDPDILRTGYHFDSFQRIPGNNIRNYGTIGFTAQLTPEFGVQLGYDNTFVDYEASGATLGSGDIVNPSLAGSLNRIEHGVHIDGQWLWRPDTVLVLGYQFRDVDYTGDEVVGGYNTNPNVFLLGPGTPVTPADITVARVMSADRNSYMHYGYVGADETFGPRLSGSVRVGGTYSDYYNDPSHTTDFTPYALISLRYRYSPVSYVEGGFNYNRGSTDLLGFQTNSAGKADFTFAAQSAVVYVSLNHHFGPKWLGSATAQYQNNTYQGGTFNGRDDNMYLMGANLEYDFNRHFSASVGYSFDCLRSGTSEPNVDTAQHLSFTRNRIYIGLTATY